jgi:hypothetical protein
MDWIIVQQFFESIPCAVQKTYPFLSLNLHLSHLFPIRQIMVGLNCPWLPIPRCFKGSFPFSLAVKPTCYVYPRNLTHAFGHLSDGCLKTLPLCFLEERFRPWRIGNETPVSLATRSPPHRSLLSFLSRLKVAHVRPMDSPLSSLVWLISTPSELKLFGKY